MNNRIIDKLGEFVKVRNIKIETQINNVFLGNANIENDIFEAYIISNSNNVKENFQGKIIAIIEDQNIMRIVVGDKESRLCYSEITGYFKEYKELKNAKFRCLYEKSAGAVIYRKGNNKIEYLIVYSKINFPGCPKGHIEYGESEENAAKREISEEVGLKVSLKPNFREKNTYIVYDTPINKEVIYFLAELPNNQSICIDENEINQFKFLELEKCKEILSENLFEVIVKAEKYLINNNFT